MKSWEDLTRAEKEKLDMYIKISNLWQPFYTVTTLGCIVGLLIAIPLVLTFYEPLIFAGVIIIFFVTFLFVFIFAFLEQDKKRLYLIFGIESLSKDIFKISREDVRKVKRVLRKEK